MSASADIYAAANRGAWAGAFALPTDTVKMALLQSGYTPNLQSDTHFSDVSSHEVVSVTYPPGGQALSGATLTSTAANSWTLAWAATTAFAYGTIVRPAVGNGLLYRQVATPTGTTAGSAPAFPTVVGEVVTDGSAIWACVGYEALVYTSAAVTWTAANFTSTPAYYAVLYDAQSGTPSVEPLITLQTFAAGQSPNGTNFTVTPDPVLGWFTFPIQ